MKKYIIISILLLAIISNISAQNKYDYKWIFGVVFDGQSHKGNIIDYDNKANVYTLEIGLGTGANNAEISDKYGNLLFYTNGCRVIDSTHQIMKNGDSLSYGEAWEKFCHDEYGSGYPTLRNTIALPDPDNEKGYYLLHKRGELILEPYLYLYMPELYYSYIDMSLNEGMGEVIIKNRIIFKTTNLVHGYMTACKHVNKKDWWILQMKNDTNIYFKTLISGDTITVDSQSIGPNFQRASNPGQAVFSPDGSKYILFNPANDVLVYDFDRETGDLSNMVQVEVQDSGAFYGVAVSSNSRYLYLSASTDLYQVDLWSDDMQSSLTNIAHIDHFQDPYFYSTFSFSQLAPDCKIYIVSGGTNNYMHVINKPNQKGKACDFRQHSLYLPNRNKNMSIPNFPHFRIDEDQICDSTITWIPEEYIVKEINILSVYPNPASDKATISLYSEGYSKGKIEIMDINGKLLKCMDIDSEEVKTIDVKKYIPGVYFVKFESGKGNVSIKKLLIAN